MFEKTKAVAFDGAKRYLCRGGDAMRGLKAALLAGFAVLCCGSASTEQVIVEGRHPIHDDRSGDIVWPQYQRVILAKDLKRSCDELHAEIAHVQENIQLITKARNDVRDRLQTEFQWETMGGHSGRAPVILARGLNEIMASEHIARNRLVFLSNLLMFCREMPPPGEAEQQ